MEVRTVPASARTWRTPPDGEPAPPRKGGIMRRHLSSRRALVSVVVAAAAALAAVGATTALADRPIDRQYGQPVAVERLPARCYANITTGIASLSVQFWTPQYPRYWDVTPSGRRVGHRVGLCHLHAERLRRRGVLRVSEHLESRRSVAGPAVHRNVGLSDGTRRRRKRQRGEGLPGTSVGHDERQRPRRHPLSCRLRVHEREPESLRTPAHAKRKFWCSVSMMPGLGVEPRRPEGHPILSRARMTSFATPATTGRV